MTATYPLAASACQLQVSSTAGTPCACPFHQPRSSTPGLFVPRGIALIPTYEEFATIKKGPF